MCETGGPGRFSLSCLEGCIPAETPTIPLAVEVPLLWPCFERAAAALWLLDLVMLGPALMTTSLRLLGS